MPTFLIVPSFNLDKPLWQWIVLILLAFIWGSSFILMKRGLESFENTQVACLRILISFLFLLPISFRNYKRIPKKSWPVIIIAGILGSGIPAFLFTKAQTQISSSLSGMLNSLVPLFTVIIGMIFFSMKFRPLRSGGVLLGLFGAIGLLSIGGGFSSENSNLMYGLYVVAATICYATNVNIIKQYLGPINSLDITAFGFVLIGPLAGIYLFSTDFSHRLGSDPEAWQNLGYIALLAIFGTAIAIIVFNMLIKRVSAVFASSVTYLIPIFALMWGFIDGENIQWGHIISIGVILSGVYLVNRDNQLERKQLNTAAAKGKPSN